MYRYKFLFCFLICLAVAGAAIPALGDFTPGHVVVVNDPSAKSAGVDSVVEFTADGTLSQTLLSTSAGITGLSRTVYDPVSGHLFYSISSYPNSMYIIREIDSTGTLIATITHPNFYSGNISMAINQNGDLYIANSQRIYVKLSGTTEVTYLFDLPYTGIGDLDIDSEGNLYLSDPFISDVVYKIFPDGSTVVFADTSDGLNSPYGIAISPEGDLYVANNQYSSAKIFRVPADGSAAEVFSTQNVSMGVLEMTFGPDGLLYTANRENDRIYTYDSEGAAATLFADGTAGLNTPSSMTFITDPSQCLIDADGDLDVDGEDLASFALNFDAGCLEQVAIAFGTN